MVGVALRPIRKGRHISKLPGGVSRVVDGQEKFFNFVIDQGDHRDGEEVFLIAYLSVAARDFAEGEIVTLVPEER